MPSALHDVKRAGYRLHRQASQGAGITLVSGCGEYVASFECAGRIAGILGKRGLSDCGDGVLESIPVYRIPVEDMPSACAKLAKSFSVALVDYICHGKAEGRFVLVWKINTTAAQVEPVKLSLDDF